MHSSEMNPVEKLEVWCKLYNLTFKKDYECPYEGDLYKAAGTAPAYPYGVMLAYVNEEEEVFLNLTMPSEGWNPTSVPSSWDPTHPDYLPQWKIVS